MKCLQQFRLKDLFNYFQVNWGTFYIILQEMNFYKYVENIVYKRSLTENESSIFSQNKNRENKSKNKLKV